MHMCICTYNRTCLVSTYLPQREDKICMYVCTSYQRYILTIRTDSCKPCIHTRGENKEYLLTIQEYVRTNSGTY